MRAEFRDKSKIHVMVMKPKKKNYTYIRDRKLSRT